MDRQWNYLPKVIRRSEWLIMDLSEKPCDSCGMLPEVHKWALLDESGQKVLFCDISATTQPNFVDHNVVGGFLPKTYV